MFASNVDCHTLQTGLHKSTVYIADCISFSKNSSCVSYLLIKVSSLIYNSFQSMCNYRKPDKKTMSLKTKKEVTAKYENDMNTSVIMVEYDF